MEEMLAEFSNVITLPMKLKRGDSVYEFGFYSRKMQFFSAVEKEPLLSGAEHMLHGIA